MISGGPAPGPVKDGLALVFVHESMPRALDKVSWRMVKACAEQPLSNFRLGLARMVLHVKRTVYQDVGYDAYYHGLPTTSF